MADARLDAIARGCRVLGQGLSVSLGLALGAKLAGSPSRVPRPLAE